LNTCGSDDSIGKPALLANQHCREDQKATEEGSNQKTPEKI